MLYLPLVLMLSSPFMVELIFKSLKPSLNSFNLKGMAIFSLTKASILGANIALPKLVKISV